MIKWIRWQGLVAFIVVVGGIAALWILFVDGIVSRLIEKTGTAIVGAEVDVKADVNLFPLGITLTGLQVTNPDAPSTNSMECSRIAFSLDTLNLLRRKVIINEMAVERIRFDTPRKRPGKVVVREEKKKSEREQSAFSIPGVDLDIKKILQNEQLESLKLIETTREELQKKKTDWQTRIDEMPNKTKLDDYQARIDKIKQAARGNVLGMAGQLSEMRKVKRDIEQDLDRVKSARSALENDLAAARNTFDRAERAPMNDVRRLRDKYGISAEGLQNMTQLLFGDNIASWVRTGLLWYHRLEPVVERAKAQKKGVTVVKPVRARGVDVRFKEYRPLPDFLIDRTAVSAETKAGMLAGTIRNITPDQNILGIPLTFSLSGEKLRAAQSIALTGALNHIRPEKPEDTGRLQIRGFKVQNLALSNNKDLPVALQDALLDIDLNGNFTQTLVAKLTANVTSAKLTIGGEESRNPFVTSVRTALSKVSNFSLTADIAGTLDNYKVDISSDLDRVLKTAVSSVVQEQGARLEQLLKTEIQERTGPQLKELQASYGGLKDQDGALENIQKQLDNLLQEAVKSEGGKLKLR